MATNTTIENYNGWENRESWGVALIIDNDQKLYNMVTKIAKRVGQDVESMALFLRNMVEDTSPIDLAQPTIWADLLGVAIGRVNWYEVADHYQPEEGWTPAPDCIGKTAWIVKTYAKGETGTITAYHLETGRYTIEPQTHYGDFDRDAFVVIDNDPDNDYAFWADRNKYGPVDGSDVALNTPRLSLHVKRLLGHDALIRAGEFKGHRMTIKGYDPQTDTLSGVVFPAGKLISINPNDLDSLETDQINVPPSWSTVRNMLAVEDYKVGKTTYDQLVEAVQEEDTDQDDDQTIEAVYNADGLIEVPCTLRQLALAAFLNCDVDDLTPDRYRDNVFDYGRSEYLILTDEEADQAWDEAAENWLDELVEGANGPYFDREAWKRDASFDGRGAMLNSWDGAEEEQPTKLEDLETYAVNVLGESFGINSGNVKDVVFEGDEQIDDFTESWLFIYRNN